MIRYFNPLQWTKWLGQFVVLWAQSVPWSCVTAAVPALLLCAGLLFLTVMSHTDGGSWRSNLITQQIETSIENEDFATAELVIKRKLADGDGSNKLLYQLASVQEELGRSDEATGLMKRVAFGRRDLDAAIWILKSEYLGKSYAELDNEQQSEFGALLELLVEEKPKDLGIKQLYADYLTASLRFDRAIPVLRELMPTQPMRGLQAAALARRVGNEELANRLASQTLERMDDLLREEPASPGLALAVVQNQLFLERHADAVRMLNKAIPRMKTEDHRRTLQQAMGDTIAAWVSLIERQKNETPIERARVLKMLQVALQYAPNNPRVLTLVADQVLKTIENDDENVQALRDALVEGSSPGIAHFVRGTAALIANNNESAERHLTLAAKHLPNSAAIMNNLAVSIAQREDGDLKQALSLSEKAIATVAKPGPYFYETRGQILYRLERYLDAIPDLERALEADALAGKAHETLAKCYAELDEPGLASDHQAAAERLAGAPAAP